MGSCHPIQIRVCIYLLHALFYPYHCKLYWFLTGPIQMSMNSNWNTLLSQKKIWSINSEDITTGNLKLVNDHGTHFSITLIEATQIDQLLKDINNNDGWTKVSLSHILLAWMHSLWSCSNLPLDFLNEIWCQNAYKHTSSSMRLQSVNCCICFDCIWPCFGLYKSPGLS